MYEELQKRIMLVAIWKEMGKKEEEIKTLLAEQGLTSDLIQQIIELTNKVQLEVEEENEADRIKYANELDEDKLEELIQRVTDWYVNGDPNHYQVSQNLKNIGVDEKYHEEIRVEAHARVCKATHREANLKIVLGIVVAFVGLIIVMLALGTTGGSRGAGRILVFPFAAGLAIIAWGLAQKNRI
jgi:hypothetical protein